MKNLTMFGLSVLGVLSLSAADPSIVADSVTIEQDSITRIARLSYELANGPAVVTVDVYTNGVNAGAEMFESAVDAGYGIAAGEKCINCVVRDNGVHTLYFRPAVEGGALIAAGQVKVVVRAWALEAPPDWMVVDLQTKSNLCYYAERDSLPGGATNRIYKTSKLLMRKIPAKNCTWRMGSPENEAGRKTDEDCHYVTLTSDYYLGVYELTQGQHSNVFVNAGVSYYSGGKQDVSKYQGDDAEVHPLEWIAPGYFRWGMKSSGDAKPGNEHGAVGTRSFFSAFRPFTGLDFDLPLEAEWEYACRAGTGTAFNNGTSSAGNVAWAAGSGTTKEVGTKNPNNWGLYDMHGNVIEWCLDAYGNDSGTIAHRGGSYMVNSTDCRSARRGGAKMTNAFDSYGYRLWAPAVAY